MFLCCFKPGLEDFTTKSQGHGEALVKGKADYCMGVGEERD